MNTIYRIVWNRALGEWTAVSELAKCHGRKASATDGRSHGLHRMAFAIACVLGGSMACVPAAYASSPASGEHAQLQKVSPRLADLNDLLSKYGNAQSTVARHVAPQAVAVGPRQQARPADPAPQPQAVAVSAHAQAPARSAPQQPVRRTAHVTSSSSRAQPSRPVRAEQVHSPQLSSDAQIAAVLQRRTQAPTGDAHAVPEP